MEPSPPIPSILGTSSQNDADARRLAPIPLDPERYSPLPSPGVGQPVVLADVQGQRPLAAQPHRIAPVQDQAVGNRVRPVAAADIDVGA